MTGHHLVLGELTDFITGETIKDTLDERYRQNIARLLVNQKGYFKKDIEPRRRLVARAGDRKAVVKIDFVVKLSGRMCMLVKFGPGSLVTRRRPALAASRLLAPYQIPIAVVTNGEGAEILEGESGHVLCQGIETIPSRAELRRICKRSQFKPVPAQRSEIESRIVYCYEVDGSCPCDEDICRL
jgi:hypothetical protein